MTSSVASRLASWFRGTFGFSQTAAMRPLPPPSQRTGSERVLTFRLIAVYGDVATTVMAVGGLSALAYHVWSSPEVDLGARKRSIDRTRETLESLHPDLVRLEGSAVVHGGSSTVDPGLWKSAPQDAWPENVAHEARDRDT